MQVRELIRGWLIEAGKDKRAEQIYRELKDNEFGLKEVGADVDSGPIRYVESWGNECSYVALNCERF